MTKWVYRFGAGTAEGRAEMKNLLGGKGANLAEMSNLGLPVPPGLSITTEVCTWYYANDRRYPADLEGHVVLGIDHHHFEEILELYKTECGVTLDTELTAANLKSLVAAYKKRVRGE